MTKIDDILDRLQKEQPVVDMPDELTERIMNSLPERRVNATGGLKAKKAWLYTTIGALVWNCILALLGWLAYKTADPTVIEKYSNILSYVIIGLFVAVVAFFVIRYFVKKRKNDSQ